MNRQRCAKCNNFLIPPIGPPTSSVLIVGDYPGKYESIKGIPIADDYAIMLRMELARVGVSMSQCRITNLWQHAKNDVCDLDWHKDMVFKEFAGKKFALLMGSDIAYALFDMSADQMYGLEVKHPMLNGTRIFISPNPAVVIHEPIGEFRLALSRFGKAVNK